MISGRFHLSTPATASPEYPNLFGKANRLRRQDFLTAAERLGVRERAMTKMIDGPTDDNNASYGRLTGITSTMPSSPSKSSGLVV